MSGFDLPGVLRRIRRAADLSQRQLAEHLGVSKTTVAAIEKGERGLDARTLGSAAALGRFRLVLLDSEGREVPGMADGAVRDEAGRRYPAHLDTRFGDQGWWHGDERYSRSRPWYTFDRVREWRDDQRSRLGTPEDHQLPQPDDAPAVRAAARRTEAARRKREEWERRVAAGDVTWSPEFECSCPPECAELDVGERPVHTDGCPCLCDID